MWRLVPRYPVPRFPKRGLAAQRILPAGSSADRKSGKSWSLFTHQPGVHPSGYRSGEHAQGETNNPVSLAIGCDWNTSAATRPIKGRNSQGEREEQNILQERENILDTHRPSHAFSWLTGRSEGPRRKES